MYVLLRLSSRDTVDLPTLTRRGYISNIKYIAITQWSLVSLPVSWLSLLHFYSLVFGRKNKKLSAANSSRQSHDRELHLLSELAKQAKYHWRCFGNWSKETLESELDNLLGTYGDHFSVNFS